MFQQQISTGATERGFQRCRKLTNQNLDPAHLVQDLDQDHDLDPFPNPVPVPVLSHDQGNADSVLGPVQDHILHLTTEKGTTQEFIRAGISEVTIEGTEDHIISVGGTEDFIHGASITEEAMEITDQIGKIIAKPTALVEGVPALDHQREGLHHQDQEAILEILISHLLIGQGGLHLPGLPRTTAELSLPSVGP